MKEQNNFVASINFETTKSCLKSKIIINQVLSLDVKPFKLSHEEVLLIIFNEFTDVFVSNLTTTINADSTNVVTGFVDLFIKTEQLTAAYPALKGFFKGINHDDISNCSGD